MDQITYRRQARRDWALAPFVAIQVSVAVCAMSWGMGLPKAYAAYENYEANQEQIIAAEAQEAASEVFTG